MSEPTKTREGDQQLPTGLQSATDAQALVMKDLEDRLAVGISRYGQGLKPFNGRSIAQDIYEEGMDFVVYWRSLMDMAEATRDELIEAVLHAWKVDSEAPPERQTRTEEDHAGLTVDTIMGWVVAHMLGQDNPATD